MHPHPHTCTTSETEYPAVQNRCIYDPGRPHLTFTLASTLVCIHCIGARGGGSGFWFFQFYAFKANYGNAYGRIGLIVIRKWNCYIVCPGLMYTRIMCVGMFGGRAVYSFLSEISTLNSNGIIGAEQGALLNNRFAHGTTGTTAN